MIVTDEEMATACETCNARCPCHRRRIDGASSRNRGHGRDRDHLAFWSSHPGLATPDAGHGCHARCGGPAGRPRRGLHVHRGAVVSHRGFENGDVDDHRRRHAVVTASRRGHGYGRGPLAGSPSPRDEPRAQLVSERAPPSEACGQLNLRLPSSLFLRSPSRLLVITVLAFDGNVVRARTCSVPVALDRNIAQRSSQSLLLLLLELANLLSLSLGFDIGIALLVALVPVDVLVGLPPANRSVDGVPEIVLCCQIPVKCFISYVPLYLSSLTSDHLK